MLLAPHPKPLSKPSAISLLNQSTLIEVPNTMGKKAMLTRNSGKNGFNDLRPNEDVQQKEPQPAVVFRDKASEGEKAKPKEK